MLNSVLGITQLVFTIIIGLYFLDQLKTRRDSRPESADEVRCGMERLNKMRRIHLSEPLTEQTRPHDFKEIIGQEDGVNAVRIALCGKNPQHILIYGPPGVGKTAASRIALEEAKKSIGTPFAPDAVFIETDATTMHYDERSIADPLIGSVHDPIYQGAGALGISGIPQPKEGAVSKAHGGVLFIDEIGELQPIQMNRLLKVLEDRCVHFESSYYSSLNKNIPSYIHEVFKNGMPADFRLIGATTRRPEEIPPALRSRCTEIFFNHLTDADLFRIAQNAVSKLAISIPEPLIKRICQHSANGRDVVKILETLAGKLNLENRTIAEETDVAWVLRSGKHTPKYMHTVSDCEIVGCVNALAVMGDGLGVLLPIEATAVPAQNGKLCCNGISETETLALSQRSIQAKSSARASLDNVITVLEELFNVPVSNYNITVNFPGGVPLDGPSAGIAFFTVCYSAIKKLPVCNKIAFTGELSILGNISPVGGVHEKIEAARTAGAKLVIIPSANYRREYDTADIKILPIKHIGELVDILKNPPLPQREYSNINEPIVAAGKEKS